MIDIKEISVLNLNPDETLIVKLQGDNFDEHTLRSLKDHLSSVFPHNKVMVFAMGVDERIDFEILREAEAQVAEDAFTPFELEQLEGQQQAQEEQEHEDEK